MRATPSPRRPSPGAAVLALLLAACAPAAPVQPPAPIGALPPSIHWVRSSAEHRALFVQVFRGAGERVRERAGELTRGRWAVVLDADETVLDNSEYQRRLAVTGASYDPATWNDWVREEAAPAQPGAAGFVGLVRQLGGRVVIVTNREEAVCPETRANLERVGIAADLVLCQRPGERGKDARFRAVAEGTAGALPPLEIAAWVGDNIRDFPGQDQPLRDAPASALEAFGRTWFLLPNPMYGSWEGNPPR